MSKRILVQGGAALTVLTLLASCSQPLTTREKSAVVGTGIGAATGAIIGAAVGNPGAGAARVVKG